MVGLVYREHALLPPRGIYERSALLRLSISFWYTDYWFSTLIFFEDKLFCDFEMNVYSFDDADWFGPRDIDVFATSLSMQAAFA